MENKLTLEEIKMLAGQERAMDTGEVKFVTVEGGRMAVDPDILDDLGLVSGQTVSNTIVIAILKSTFTKLRAMQRPN